MDIKPYDKTIRELLISRRQFMIPRFQREYSWDKANYHEFFDDMIGNIKVADEKLITDQYFLGTMLFIGDFTEGTEKRIFVVDGQQRLTTITILFSALSDQFIRLGEETLSKELFKYIMTTDDNGDEIRILSSQSHHPFFAYFIQDRKKETPQVPNTDEEICIKETYDYYIAQTNEDKIKSHLIQKARLDQELVKRMLYIEILKVLRDQVLNSTFISISTKEQSQANRIFEILNAKGKKLAHIDLIKNKIFETLNTIEPVDFAEDRWRKIRDVLCSRRDMVGIATFYRHYWLSKYKLTYSSKLFSEFDKTITPKNEENYKAFLNDMYENANVYVKIINPSRIIIADELVYLYIV